MDEGLHEEALAEQAKYREEMKRLSVNWDEVKDFLGVIGNGNRVKYEAFQKSLEETA